MIRWEYKSYLFERSDKLLEKLNSLGTDSWEAFHFMPMEDGRLRIFFKRQQQKETT